MDVTGADDGTRTRNLLFTKQLLYQLSYVGATRRAVPQMTPSAPGNDRAARSDGSSARRRLHRARGSGRPGPLRFGGRLRGGTPGQQVGVGGDVGGRRGVRRQGSGAL